MALTFYVGEQPMEPLIITVTDRNLSGIGVTTVGDDLPDNNVSVADAATGRVQIDFLEPFTEPGIYRLQLRLTNVDAEVDYTSPVEFTVEDKVNALAASLVTRAEVDAVTGTSVSLEDVAAAQALVGLVVDRDLSDTAVLAGISTRNLSFIKQAIAWQAAGARTGAAEVQQIPQGAREVTTGNVRLVFGPSGPPEVDLAPLARLAISRLSWMGSRSIQLLGFSSRRARFSPLVSDDHAWHMI